MEGKSAFVFLNESAVELRRKISDIRTTKAIFLEEALLDHVSAEIAFIWSIRDIKWLPTLSSALSSSTRQSYPRTRADVLFQNGFHFEGVPLFACEPRLFPF